MTVPPAGVASGDAASTDDLALVTALQRGDEAAFLSLIERFHPALVRVALLYVSSPAIAEEVAQETWLGVLQGLARFEGRSSLKTWVFQILINRAKTRAQREGRSIPFSALEDEIAHDEPALEPERFLPDDHRWSGHWVAPPPRSWEMLPEERLLSAQTWVQIQAAIAALPPSQQAIITLRDIEGWTAADVGSALGISETHQRVLLHRARSKVRRALECYLDDEQGRSA